MQKDAIEKRCKKTEKMIAELFRMIAKFRQIVKICKLKQKSDRVLISLRSN